MVVLGVMISFGAIAEENKNPDLRSICIDLLTNISADYGIDHDCNYPLSPLLGKKQPPMNLEPFYSQCGTVLTVQESNKIQTAVSTVITRDYYPKAVNGDFCAVVKNVKITRKDLNRGYQAFFGEELR
jgi:hypothetical protein